jgi:hypothetical protein
MLTQNLIRGQVFKNKSREKDNSKGLVEGAGSFESLRKGVFRRLIHHPLAMPYYRLALLVIGANLWFLSYRFDTIEPLMAEDLFKIFFHVVIANFVVAILIRSQFVVNLLFKGATSIPTRYPLWLRWSAGKVYHFGGVHVGAYLSGSLALMGLCGLLWFFSELDFGKVFFFLLNLHALILLTVMLCSLPKVRERHHNLFEVVARFGNWASLLLFWIESVLYHQQVGQGPFLQSPYFYILCFLTLLVILPWLRLRKVPLDVVAPSDHVALAKFDYGVTPFAGSSTDLSWNPLFEWHSFANVPSPRESGFRLTISRAGDWTGEFINRKPSHIWVKGIPTAGVGNIERCFKKVIWVATGSGVGPCIPHLLKNEVPSRLVWATRSPENTYGKELVEEIKAVQPEAIIWDTTAYGKPDLAELAYRVYREFDAEAVICISNKKVTYRVNYELEARGIPAFGAIWDS